MKVIKFWMVHGINQRSPAFRHATKAGAQAEAKRLAEQAPGTIFVVLAAREAYCAAIQPVDQIKVVKNEADGAASPDDDIPF